MNYRSLSRSLVLVAGLLVLVGSTPLVAEDPRCSTRRVSGRWGFSERGYTDGASTEAVGVFTVDKLGNVEGTSTYNIGGDINDVPFSGTLTVNSDCTGHMSLPDIPIEYDLVVLDKSVEILFVTRDAHFVWSADAKRLPSDHD